MSGIRIEAVQEDIVVIFDYILPEKVGKIGAQWLHDLLRERGHATEYIKAAVEDFRVNGQMWSQSEGTGPFRGDVFYPTPKLRQWANERGIGTGKPELLPQNRESKHIDARMLATIRDDPEAVCRSLNEWAERLTCAKSTVANCKTWKTVCRPARERERLARGRRLPRNKGVAHGPWPADLF